ncbi:SDR family oxidoreductase [Pseudomonas neustonica]|uniref:SDR family oxidoreductase n=1 Tax=Pseudomonas neustonica TaxID=2487346 RepID=A0ABX9XM90_9PSED|nr:MULTISPECIES: SDR family oxidoreductase [Pseudomonas]MAB22960.1 NAD(P)-dependent oxidoreductase [Pseudomonadales bacterium]ROZ86258.1 SDR family oxidoreductase [Pseudomonas sp. SSM44]ROZ87983.1 SDR family oxidoreductase [Pseudomonas neustonica]|tara:strand:+ start:2251 stop:3093 length:843 start_codon:yes stop_codon:yes gene_type:complete
MKQVVIAGCGDVGTALAQQLLARGWQVYGLRRDPTQLPEGIVPIAADLTQADKPADWPAKVDYLVYCPAAGKRDPELYQQLYVDGLEHVLAWVKSSGQRLNYLLQVSSTGVYAQSEGEWVTENSRALADSPTSQKLLAAEDAALRSGVPASVVRLAGIYGPGRNRLIQQVRDGLQVPAEPPQYTNRIHRDDAVSLLSHLLALADQRELLAPCYLGVDDEPASLFEVTSWLAEQLGTSLQADGPVSTRTGSKRCSNALVRESGWQPAYPSFREGYAELLKG